MMTVYPLRTRPLLSEKTWADHRLLSYYHKGEAKKNIGESLELSGASVIANGEYRDSSVNHLIARFPTEFLGKNHRMFPYAFRLVDTTSVRTPRVHTVEHGGGTLTHFEMFCVLHAEPNAGFYVGLAGKLDREEYLEHVRNHTMTQIMHFIPASKGDILLVPGGVLHTVGGGILAALLSEGVNEQYKTDEESAEKTWEHIAEFGRPVKFTGEEIPIPSGSRFEAEDPAQVCRMEKLTIGKTYEEGASPDFRAVFIAKGEGKIMADGNATDFYAGNTFIIPAACQNLVLIPDEAERVELLLIR